jgi:hypothetical protein
MSGVIEYRPGVLSDITRFEERSLQSSKNKGKAVFK